MVDEEISQPDLGAANAALLEETVNSSFDELDDTEMQAERRFLLNVIDAIRSRKSTSANRDKPELSIFLLVPYPRQLAQLHQARHEPLFSNGSTELAGQVWFSSVALNSGFAFDLPSLEVGELFNIMIEAGLGELPAVLFDPRPGVPEFRLYPNGIVHDENCEKHPFDEVALSVDALSEFLETFYEINLKNPSRIPKGVPVWADTTKCQPAPRTEEAIQGPLIVGIRSKFGCRTLWELPSEDGRADVAIYRRPAADEQGWILHFVLELKVLRSVTSSGGKSTISIPKEVKKGLGQAIAFKKNHDAKEAWLCCFDMRKTNEGENCFDKIRAKADKAKIHLKHWFLFNTDDEKRLTEDVGS